MKNIHLFSYFYNNIIKNRLILKLINYICLMYIFFQISLKIKKIKIFSDLKSNF